MQFVAGPEEKCFGQGVRINLDLTCWTIRPFNQAMANILTWKVVDDAAAELGVSQDARLKWRQAGRGVPPAWRISIVERLARDRVSVAFADFDALPETPGRIAA